MKDSITVNLCTDHALEFATDIIGREGEGDATQFVLYIPKELSDYSIYFDVEKPSGEKFRSPRLNIENGVALYNIPRYLLTEAGEIKVQAIAQSDNGEVWKTDVKKCINRVSINALDKLPEAQKEDFMFTAQKVLNALSQEVAEVAEAVADDPEFGEDVAAILEPYIDARYAKLTDDIAKKLQLKPEFANSKNECTDTSKLYVLPDGYIYGYIKTQVLQGGCTNVIPTSTVAGGGSIYNTKGYKLGIRLNSTADEKEQLWCITTGFISVTKNSVLRIKRWANGKSDYLAETGNVICLYDSSYALLTKSQEGTSQALNTNGIGVFDDVTDIYTVKLSDILNNTNIAFARVSTIVTAKGATATDSDASQVMVTVDQEIADPYYVDAYAWASTGHAFVPADYETRICNIELVTTGHEARLNLLEEDSGIPKYWTEELKTKADAIQLAMEKAGRNKSAFLWYTDAHWVNGNAKISPSLLNYLYRNTPMNKVNFGGDIIGDSLLATRDEMKYLYEWRKAIKDLPNHHSVLGNHDDFKSDSVDYESDNFTYSFLIATEETPDMVMGGDFYYYIDNKCEKTRYLYLDSGKRALSDDETAFVINALTTTPNGWHIVAISHIWWQYASASTPTTGAINAYCQKMLNLFDAYNARQSGSVTMVSTANAYNFSSCGGKVEFCIGGHIHVDYDLSSVGGIPVIITTADANQNRVLDSQVDSGTMGTISESAVFGIVADYNNRKITVVGVGRGTSREIIY